jgi:penicillin-binding protein 1A
MKRLLFRVTVFLVVIGTGIMAGGYVALVQGVPQIEEIKAYQPSISTEVYADDDTLIGEFRVEKGDYVKISAIPEHLIRAVIAVEDSRFWYHRGIDVLGILRALSKDIRAGRFKEGASTITQQLTKVVFLSPERTVVRKLKEIVLAMRIEKNLSKEEILELRDPGAVSKQNLFRPRCLWY